MRLLALTNTGQVSGAERVLVRTVEAAVARGWEVACACPPGPLVEQVSAAGARVVRLPELGLAPGPRPLAAVRTVGRWLVAARRLRAEARGADVVLANALLALPVVRLARPAAPVAWLAHDVVVRRDRLRLYRLCRGALTRVVGVSEAVARRLRDVAPGGPEVGVVHNGVAWPVDPAPPEPRGAVPVVGLNGLLTSWKGQHLMLDAAERLPDRVRVELMGGQLEKDGAYADGVRARAGDPALGGRVEVLGHVADPLARMRTWTVAVSASTDPEACPLNVLEAMSLGLPVVASDHGGSPEVLDGHGLLVAPGDGAALADALTRLLGDDDLRARLGAGGRERVGVAHRADVQQQRLLDVLVEMAGADAEGSS